MVGRSLPVSACAKMVRPPRLIARNWAKSPKARSAPSAARCRAGAGRPGEGGSGRPGREPGLGGARKLLGQLDLIGIVVDVGVEIADAGLGHEAAIAGIWSAPHLPFQRGGGRYKRRSPARRGPPAGASPSGKAPVFGTGIRRFESCRPSQLHSKLLKNKAFETPKKLGMGSCYRALLQNRATKLRPRDHDARGKHAPAAGRLPLPASCPSSASKAASAK